jgi:hypothetical protein
VASVPPATKAPAAKARRPTPPHKAPVRPKTAPFRGQFSFQANRGGFTPVISRIILLLVVLIPCAAAAVTRYMKKR